MLKPQDILVLLKLVAWNRDSWSYQELADELSMSPSEVHAGINRASVAQLVDVEKRKPNRSALYEFLVHGMRYSFPPERGGVSRGIPTCHAAPFTKGVFARGDDPPPVWPHRDGKIRGESFSPLYRSAPEAAERDEVLYRLLVLIDLVRGGNTMERKWAQGELRKALKQK